MIVPRPKIYATRRDWLVANPKVQMLISARQRAKRDGVPFDLSASDFDIPSTCPIFGHAMECGTRRNHRYSPTLDRIIPEQGYVLGNVQVISHRANMLKGNASIAELKQLVSYLDSLTECKFAAKRLKSTSDSERYKQAPADSSIAS